MPVFATVVRWRTVPPQVLQVAALLSTCDMVSDLRSRVAALTHVAAEQACFVNIAESLCLSIHEYIFCINTA